MLRHAPKLPKNILVLFSVILLGCLIVMSFIAYLSMVNPVNKNDKTQIDFMVNKGDSTLTIANNLEKAGLIRSPSGFRLIVKKEGLAGKLQAGDYHLSPSMSSSEIAHALTKGFATDLVLTIPEGYRNEEIADKVELVFDIPSADFMTAAKGHEGFLFPDTYYFGKNTTADQIVQKMLSNFKNKTASLAFPEVTKSHIILASLIERETKSNDEKPIVAGILAKRLSAQWPLQLDATIQYIAGKKGQWWPNTTLLDRQRPSLYNTYIHKGYPPGPICNPGIESLKAAQAPDMNTPYWYYLHDKNGQIHYAATEVEHEANIAKYIN